MASGAFTLMDFVNFYLELNKLAVTYGTPLAQRVADSMIAQWADRGATVDRGSKAFTPARLAEEMRRIAPDIYRTQRLIAIGSFMPGVAPPKPRAERQPPNPEKICTFHDARVGATCVKGEECGYVHLDTKDPEQAKRFDAVAPTRRK